MIIYPDLLKLLAEHGWTTYRLQKERKISNGTIIQIRAHKSFTLNTLDTICKLCHCQPGDILEYREDNEDKGEIE